MCQPSPEAGAGKGGGQIEPPVSLRVSNWNSQGRVLRSKETPEKAPVSAERLLQVC